MANILHCSKNDSSIVYQTLIRFDGGLTSLFSYVGEDPVNWVGLDGLKPHCIS